MFWILLLRRVSFNFCSLLAVETEANTCRIATGTIEPGGWTTRELLQVLQGLAEAGVKIIGSDIVEFSPVYDNKAETTALLVVEIVYELLQWMIKVPVAPKGV